MNLENYYFFLLIILMDNTNHFNIRTTLNFIHENKKNNINIKERIYLAKYFFENCKYNQTYNNTYQNEICNKLRNILFDY